MENHNQNPITNEVCFKLHKFMRENHITYESLATSMGVTLQSVSNHLRLKRPFSWKVAHRWVKGFEDIGYQVNATYLVTGVGPITNNPKHDPDANHSYGGASERGFLCARITEYESAAIDEKGDVINSFDKAMMALIKTRQERDYLREEYQKEKDKNDTLLKKLQEIQRILNSN